MEDININAARESMNSLLQERIFQSPINTVEGIEEQICQLTRILTVSI